MMKIRWQRVLIYPLAGLCCGLLLFIWNQRYIQSFHLDIMLNDLRHQARLMETPFQLNESTTDGQVDAIREQLFYHLTIINRRGIVVADSLFSGTDLEKMGNQVNQKEIVEAAQKGTGSDLRYYETTGGGVLLVATRSSGGGYIRLSRPVSGPHPVEDPL
jgi:two-component system phosphate regulon sensor histidine kinase PhoR